MRFKLFYILFVIMLTHQTQIRVRYGEVDQMGFLYHSHYVEYFDVARTEMMRSLGLPNVEIEAAGVMLPVMKVEIDYRSPAAYDDLLTIRTTLRSLPRATIRFDYEVFTPSGDLITTGSVTLAFMHAQSKRACRPPALMMEVLSSHFEQQLGAQV